MKQLIPLSALALLLNSQLAFAQPAPTPQPPPTPTPTDAAPTTTTEATPPATPTAETAPAATPAPNAASTATAPSLDAETGDAAAQLDDDQPGATDSLLNGEALKLYGFGDVGYRQMLVPKTSPWLLYLNRHPSMFVGHLNFYFDSQLAERWRALAEVRFTYQPHGGWKPSEEGDIRHVDTRIADHTDFTRDRAVGGLMIERAFIEY